MTETIREWRGFSLREFVCDGRIAYHVPPKHESPGRPWIWRVRFWDAWPQVDVALLERGFHAVYLDVVDLYGSPRAVAHGNAFYRYLTEELGLAKRGVLEGFSRGGLMAYNWAAQNPEKTACIYADAPVCDFKSWPGGKGRGPGSAEDWRKCLLAYGLTQGEALTYPGNPIDNLEPLARAGIPLIHVCGAVDEVVPVEENTTILAERYRALGGKIEVILKPGVGHHPHSLEDPAPVVEYILRHAASR